MLDILHNIYQRLEAQLHVYGAEILPYLLGLTKSVEDTEVR